MKEIVLASHLRERYHQSKIVFITSHTELEFLSFFYKVETLDFIQKNCKEDMNVVFA